VIKITAQQKHVLQYIHLHYKCLLLLLTLSDHFSLVDYPATVFGVRLHTQKVQK